jgi:CubicO group peptidase (beta-lactamase class C family)
MDLQGCAAAGFEPVAGVFRGLLSADAGYAGQVAVYHGGELVVDLWGGPALGPDSLLPVASSTKGAAYVCAAVLAEAGDLRLDRPVASYWPGFAAAGKAETTVRQLLSHRAGLVGVDGGFTLADLHEDRVLAARLARQRPYWRPGTAHGYHGLTMGALVGELVHRITGQTLQAFYTTQIRRPRGVDFFVGLPETHEHRFVPLTAPADAGRDDPVDAGSLTGVASAVPVADRIAVHNSRAFRAAGPASSGGVASARGLALLYASCISQVGSRRPLLAPDTVAEWAQIHSTGHDLVMRRPSRFGLGFQLPGEDQPYLSARAFGHNGSGGSWGFADPRTGIAFGYTRRRVAHDGDDSGTLARTAQACAVPAAEAANGQ